MANEDGPDGVEYGNHPPVDPNYPHIPNPIPNGVEKGTDSVIDLTQNNYLDDSDTLTNIQVKDYGDVGQIAKSFGGSATAGNGITNGLGQPGSGAASVSDDMAVTGVSSASADAEAIAKAFTQDIQTGANLQQNAAVVDVVGSNRTVGTVGDDDESGLAEGTNGLGTVGGTDTLVAIDQQNTLYDNDKVHSPQVRSEGDEEFNQSATATGGVAASGIGIAALGGGVDYAVPATVVGDKLDTEGTSSASADAYAEAKAFTQDIETGANRQFNTVQISQVGLNQNVNTVGEDESGNGAGSAQYNSYAPGSTSLISGDDDGGSEPPLDQNNFGQDTDRITNDYGNPSVVNGWSGDHQGEYFSQTVTATGNRATSGDGIYADASTDGLLFANSGDDATMKGSSSASADAEAAAKAFTQDIATGGNTQVNQLGISNVGASQNIIDIGENGSEDSNLYGNTDSNGGGVTLTSVVSEQINTLNDKDTIENPEVVNEVRVAPDQYYNPYHGWLDEPGYNDADNDFDQTVTARGGTAYTGDGIESLGGLDSTSVQVGGNLSMEGSASASADAAASATAFAQSISTGGNVQVNEYSLSVVGGNESLTSVGEDDNGSDRLLTTPEEATTTNATVTQDNTLSDDDYIYSPTVENRQVAESEDDGVFQTVSAYGNTARESATVNHGADGIATGGNVDSLLALRGTGVTDDAHIAGSTSASADAAASASAFTQEIHTGGNTQYNIADVSIVGANKTISSVGEDSSADDDGDADVSYSYNLGSDTNSVLDVNQSNQLSDNDYVYDPKVANQSEAWVNQTVTARGGNATANDGISLSGGNLVNGGTIGDDLSISGDASASADAYASAVAFTQDISTGGNVQVNSTGIAIVGGSQTMSDTGGDDTGGGSLTQPSMRVSGGVQDYANYSGTDTVITVDQSNGRGWDAADDQDYIDNATVRNDKTDSYTPPDDTNVLQNVTARGGTARSGDGIDVGPGMVFGAGLQIDDDGSVIGKSSASADAHASAEAFTQDIETGRNTQQNVVTASIIGANENGIMVGEDDTAGGDDMATGGYSGSADTNMTGSQGNHLNDSDDVWNPVVTNEGDLFQAGTGNPTTSGASAYGGTASAGYGIVNGSNGIDDAVYNGPASNNTAAGSVANVDDDFEVDGSSIASADATASAEAFTQEIHTGGNVQVNSASLSVVGINGNTQTVGDDDWDDASDIMPNESLAPVLGDDGYNDVPSYGDYDNGNAQNANGTDTLFSFDQVNSLVDQDTVSNPKVINHEGGDVIQSVYADGGTAWADGGIDGGVNALFDSYDIGDDFLMDGTVEASADALGVAEAFTQTIITGANVQVNAVNVSVVGGSSTVSMAGDDDLG